MITAKDITRTFSLGTTETKALRGVSLSVKKGEFVAIIGKSGAGKSTFMYQLSLLDTPTSGALTIHDTDVLALSPSEKTRFRLENLGYVFQDYALVPELTAEENVLLPLLMRGAPLARAREKAREVLERLTLGHRLDRRPGRLSGGEQQRVSIARAIAHDPLILFADEPTANLDTVTSKELLCYLEELNRSGQTILMVTHELDYAARAGRIVELSDGCIVKEGRPSEVLPNAPEVR